VKAEKIVGKDNTSPLPTPTAEPESPTPTPKPTLSPAARAALEYVVSGEGVPIDALIIGDEHPVEYPDLGRTFQAIRLMDTRPEGRIYKLLVDLKKGRVLCEEEVSALQIAEVEAYQAKYGKLEPALYERLQRLKDEDDLTVAYGWQLNLEKLWLNWSKKHLLFWQKNIQKPRLP
jgi:hypothetical protein